MADTDKIGDRFTRMEFNFELNSSKCLNWKSICCKETKDIDRLFGNSGVVHPKVTKSLEVIKG